MYESFWESVPLPLLHLEISQIRYVMYKVQQLAAETINNDIMGK
jgi:hypothetical protein